MFNLAFEGLNREAWHCEARDGNDLDKDDSDFNMSRFKLLRFLGPAKGCPAQFPRNLPYYHHAAQIHGLVIWG
jgi:hypothetical protein